MGAPRMKKLSHFTLHRKKCIKNNFLAIKKEQATGRKSLRERERKRVRESECMGVVMKKSKFMLRTIEERAEGKRGKIEFRAEIDDWGRPEWQSGPSPTRK
ncbi:hypothetical protein CDAR_265281 [Caerostris darwini]|uniref:Uncharacterized protein n=1 Tax=Caerostris darwini TaxID=1538125 RepID=A0AAV4W6B3_9ARAC|nr:hypothetical protein CDAR_265281 [Caerostris darwini]